MSILFQKLVNNILNKNSHIRRLQTRELVEQGEQDQENASGCILHGLTNMS